MKFFRDQATYKKYSESLEAALAEERAARDLLKSKRQEIDSLQSMITKVKNAISVEDIDGRVSAFWVSFYFVSGWPGLFESFLTSTE